MKHIIGLLLFVVVAAIVSKYTFATFVYDRNETPTTAAPVVEDLPPANQISPAVLADITAKSDFILVRTPTPQSVITDPLQVSGMARGPWYFEGSFPVVVTDWNGLIIGEGFVTAQTDWMTTDFVPFTGEIRFTVPPDTAYNRGTVIFQKANASGLPENDDALEIPVLFE